jgi:hypothetical protein
MLMTPDALGPTRTSPVIVEQSAYCVASAWELMVAVAWEQMEAVWAVMRWIVSERSCQLMVGLRAPNRRLIGRERWQMMTGECC